MRILVISQYFPPESGAAAQRIGSFARHLSKSGHDVSVICQTPNYPAGDIYPGFNNGFREVTQENGYRVIRALTYPTKNVGFLKRLVNYLVFSFSAFVVGLVEPRPDLILISSPPILPGGSALLLSFIKRTPLVVDIRDVWPEVAMESGGVNKVIFSPLRILEKLLYRRASVVMAVSEGMVEFLAKENSLDKDKFKPVYNGTDLSETFLVKKVKVAPSTQKFTVIYSGNIGTQQKIGNLIKAAGILKTNQEIQFLICGEGVERKEIERQIKAKKLSNVKFLGLLPYEETISKVRSSDLGLILLTSNRSNDSTLPSKIFDYCFTGTPVLASGGKFTRKFINENDIGFWVDPENPRKLADKILEVSKTSRRGLFQMGKKGQALVETTYNRRAQAKKLDEILREVIGKPVGPASLKLSIVILSWNSKKDLEICLPSVFKNTSLKEKEVIVVDNGSADGSDEFIKKNYPEVTLIRNEENMGTTVSRNQAFKLAKGEYIMILDSDTKVGPGAIDLLVKEMERRPKVGIIGPKLIFPSGELRYSCREFPTVLSKFVFRGVSDRIASKLLAKEEYRAWDHSSPAYVGYMIGACLLIRRSCMDDVGFLDEKFFYAPEDIDYCLRVWKNGWKVMYEPRAVVAHKEARITTRGSIFQRFKNPLFWAHIKGLVVYFFKHKYLLKRPGPFFEKIE